MSAAELLAQAQRVLDGAGAEGLNARLAAFLSRQALEEIVDQRCADLGVTAPWAKARSKLIVLRALNGAATADTAALAWNRLSNACHVHAYEMAPSAAEVAQLCRQVASLLPVDTLRASTRTGT